MPNVPDVAFDHLQFVQKNSRKLILMCVIKAWNIFARKNLFVRLAQFQYLEKARNQALRSATDPELPGSNPTAAVAFRRRRNAKAPVCRAMSVHIKDPQVVEIIPEPSTTASFFYHSLLYPFLYSAVQVWARYCVRKM
ncbi:hypothetical protein V5799_033494 [Amblyomma americanum]|uniref:Uncharacterized protein n=1 Tax=Amblyomma americanum TaxID=6943 RepID=A0AAQ4DN57_AMBAM